MSDVRAAYGGGEGRHGTYVWCAAGRDAGIGAVEPEAAGLVSVDTFDICGVAITPPAPAAQNSFLGVAPGGSVRAGQRYTLTATLPAGPHTRTKITHQIVLR